MISINSDYCRFSQPLKDLADCGIHLFRNDHPPQTRACPSLHPACHPPEPSPSAPPSAVAQGCRGISQDRLQRPCQVPLSDPISWISVPVCSALNRVQSRRGPVLSSTGSYQVGLHLRHVVAKQMKHVHADKHMLLACCHLLLKVHIRNLSRQYRFWLACCTRNWCPQISLWIELSHEITSPYNWALYNNGDKGVVALSSSVA